MRKTVFLLSALLLATYSQARKVYTVASPDKQMKLTVTVDDKIYYGVEHAGNVVIEDGVLQMELKGQTLGTSPKVTGKTMRTVDETIKPVVPFKFSTIENKYNALTLKFKGDYSVEFRTFDDGIAYRFITDKKGEIEVTDELLQIGIPQESLLHAQQSSRMKTSSEELYQHIGTDKWNETAEQFSTMPLLMELKNGYKVMISESSLTDYPGMFLSAKKAKNKISSIFPQNPVEFGDDGDRSVKIVKEADYIAKTSGKRSFPWRYFVIVKDDGKLIENTMTAKLAEPCEIADPSWIKPGVTTWEWWNGAAPYGPEVDFAAGCNTETYKYFIDFASKFGIRYILLDEGWAKSTRDPFTPNDKLDLQELIKYGNQKNVGIILWLTWLTVENNFTLFKTFADWGVKGVKIDFMDRSDQWMVNFYERTAKEAAKNKLFIDFHGAYKPSGLEYKYPNVLTYEGVRGMEYMSGCHPDNSMYYPFMRNAVGPMDYTPGAMLNYQPNTYRAGRPNSGCMGTRAYQMALFVLWETGLQMMADNPTLYYQNEDCARFMASVPVTTDETVSLDSKVGEYAIVAKKKGNKWYIGGITNNKENSREFEVKLDFLSDGKAYRMTSYEDGKNANWQAMHYVKKTTDVKKGQTLKIKMARNGGYAAVIE